MSELIVLAELPEDAHTSVAVVNVCLLLALAAGVLKCFTIIRREQTHTLCVVSLAVTLISGLILATGGLARSFYVIGKAGQILIGGTAIVAAIVAAVLAVVGLMDFRRRRSEFFQGRSQACWAIILSGIPLFGFGVGVWYALNEQEVADTAALNNAGANNSITEYDALADHSEDPPPETERFEELNFELTPAGAHWTKLDAVRLHPNARLMYASVAPQTFFMAIAERAGLEAGINNDALVEVVQANARAAGTVRFDLPRPRKVGAVDGLHMEADVEATGQRMKFMYWVASHHGFLYQLVSYAQPQNAHSLAKRHAAMLEGFRLLVPDEVAHAAGIEEMRELRSEAFGYRVDLSGDPWHSWRTEGEPFPAADLSAGLMSRAVVGVVTVTLPNLACSWEDLSAAMTPVVLPNYDPSRQTALREVSADGMPGRAFNYEDASFTYKFRLYRQKDTAYLVAGWVEGKDAPLLAAIERALGRISFTHSAAPYNGTGAEAARLSRGLVLNDLGVSAFDRQELSAARTYFQTALELRPKDEAVLINYLEALVRQGEQRLALAELDERLPQFAKSQTLRVTRARLLAGLGETDKSREAFEQLFRDGYQDENDLIELINVQLADDDVDRALATVDEYLKRRSSPTVERWKGQLLVRKGEFQEAVELLDNLRKKRPRDIQVIYDLATAHESGGQYTTALELCDELDKLGSSGEELHLLRGRCQIGLKWPYKARESFEQALVVNPRSEEAQRWISIASGLLGQGNTTWIKTPIEPVPLPPAIRGRLETLTTSDPRADDYGASELHRVTGYDFTPEKTWKCTCYRKVKIVTQEGVDRYGSISIVFDPLAERVYANKVAVYDAAGAIVAEGNLNDYYVTADSQDDLATGDHTLTIPVPQLKPGCTLEFVHSRERLAPDDEFGFETVLLASTAPVQLAAAFVTGDVDQVASTSTGPAEHQADRLKYWAVEDPPVYVYEANQPPLEDFLPIVQIGDAHQTWDEVGTEYHRAIADRLTDDAVAIARSKEVTRGLATDEEKVAALARYVQKQIAYQGLEFGVRGQIPNKPSRTLETGYGDCKDHAVLLKQMLNAAGVSADLALVPAASRLDERLPSIDQFNHVVVAAAPAGAEGGRVFLDCTAKYGNPANVLASAHEDLKVLLIDAGAPRLASVPRRPDLTSEMRCRREVTIEWDGVGDAAADASVREDVRFNVASAPAYRALLAGYEPRDRKTVIADVLRSHERIHISELEVEGLDAPTEPLTLRLSYRVKNAFHQETGSGKRFIGRLPIPWEAHWADVDPLKERKTPFRFAPAKCESIVRLVVPDGLAQMKPHESQRSAADNRFLEWTIEDAPTAGESRLIVFQRPGTFRADEYDEYAGEVSELVELLEKPITLSRTK